MGVGGLELACPHPDVLCRCRKVGTAASHDLGWKPNGSFARPSPPPSLSSRLSDSSPVLCPERPPLHLHCRFPEAMGQVRRPRPNFRTLLSRLERVPSRGGPSQVFLASGFWFCEKGKVKVLRIKETRQMYTLNWTLGAPPPGR